MSDTTMVSRMPYTERLAAAQQHLTQAAHLLSPELPASSTRIGQLQVELATIMDTATAASMEATLAARVR